MKVLKQESAVTSEEVVEEANREVNSIKDMVEFGYPEPDIFALDYRLTSKCNYDCFYCTDLHNNSEQHLRMNDYSLKRLDELIGLLDQDIRFYMYGGEPTVHQDFVEIAITALRSLKYNSVVEIQTNLWIKEKRLEKIAKLLREESDKSGIPMNFLCSYHHGECDFREFLKSCAVLKKYGLLDQITVMYQTDAGETLLKEFRILKALYARDVKTELLPLLCGSVDENDPNPYKEVDGFYNNPDAVALGKGAQAQSDILQVTLKDGTKYMTNASYLWLQRANTFTGYQCAVGTERFIINGDGEVYKCFNEIFDPAYESQFNIFDPEVNYDIQSYLDSMQDIECTFGKCYFEFCHRKYKK